MHIKKARQIINTHSEEVRADLTRRMDSTGKTLQEVMTEDPFFAGQMYTLGALALKLNSAELHEEHERDLRRTRR